MQAIYVDNIVHFVKAATDAYSSLMTYANIYSSSALKVLFSLLRGPGHAVVFVG